MGWMSWAAFFCETDCIRNPDACINEELYLNMATELVRQEFPDVGYRSIHIDDCWSSRERDAHGNLQANKTRFPHGIKYLSKKMHEQNLLMALYTDIGSATCAGYPGSLKHERQDAQSLEDWQIDYLKHDGCNLNPMFVAEKYKLMGKELAKLRRKIVYSCEWPLYLISNTSLLNFTEVAENCNLWRSFDDVAGSWNSISSIINWHVRNQERLIPVQGPGAWNDPDMLVVGQANVSLDMARTQMSVWCIWSAPLIFSVDLRELSAEARSVLQNRHAIAVDQDPAGRMGAMVLHQDSILVFAKQLGNESDGRIAVVVTNMAASSKYPNSIKFNLKSLNLSLASEKYQIFEIWTNATFGAVDTSGTLSVTVRPTASAFILGRPVHPNDGEVRAKKRLRMHFA